MRRLFVPGYYSGFSNNKMSLDIAIVLAYLTGRVLVPYRFRLPRRFPVDLPPDRVLEPMLVPDLFDIPVPYSDEYLFKTWISVPGALHVCMGAGVRIRALLPRHLTDRRRTLPALPQRAAVRLHASASSRTKRRTCTSTPRRSATIRTSSTLTTSVAGRSST